MNSRIFSGYGNDNFSQDPRENVLERERLLKKQKQEEYRRILEDQIKQKTSSNKQYRPISSNNPRPTLINEINMMSSSPYTHSSERPIPLTIYHKGNDMGSGKDSVVGNLNNQYNQLYSSERPQIYQPSNRPVSSVNPRINNLAVENSTYNSQLSSYYQLQQQLNKENSNYIQQNQINNLQANLGSNLTNQAYESPYLMNTSAYQPQPTELYYDNNQKQYSKENLYGRPYDQSSYSYLSKEIPSGYQPNIQDESKFSVSSTEKPSYFQSIANQNIIQVNDSKDFQKRKRLEYQMDLKKQIENDRKRKEEEKLKLKQEEMEYRSKFLSQEEEMSRMKITTLHRGQANKSHPFGNDPHQSSEPPQNIRPQQHQEPEATKPMKPDEFTENKPANEYQAPPQELNAYNQAEQMSNYNQSSPQQLSILQRVQQSNLNAFGNNSQDPIANNISRQAYPFAYQNMQEHQPDYNNNVSSLEEFNLNEIIMKQNQIEMLKEDMKKMLIEKNNARSKFMFYNQKADIMRNIEMTIENMERNAAYPMMIPPTNSHYFQYDYGNKIGPSEPFILSPNINMQDYAKFIMYSKQQPQPFLQNTQQPQFIPAQPQVNPKGNEIDFKLLNYISKYEQNVLNESLPKKINNDLNIMSSRENDSIIEKSLECETKHILICNSENNDTDLIKSWNEKKSIYEEQLRRTTAPNIAENLVETPKIEAEVLLTNANTIKNDKSEIIVPSFDNTYKSQLVEHVNERSSEVRKIESKESAEIPCVNDNKFPIKQSNNYTNYERARTMITRRNTEIRYADVKSNPNLMIIDDNDPGEGTANQVTRSENFGAVDNNLIKKSSSLNIYEESNKDTLEKDHLIDYDDSIANIKANFINSKIIQC